MRHVAPPRHVLGTRPRDRSKDRIGVHPRTVAPLSVIAGEPRRDLLFIRAHLHRLHSPDADDSEQHRERDAETSGAENLEKCGSADGRRHWVRVRKDQTHSMPLKTA